jgi:hypothetical protein
MSRIDWTTGDEGPIKVADGLCHLWTEDQHSRNCIIAACNVGGHESSQPLNIFNGPTFYGLIKQWCEPDLAGGLSPSGGDTYIRATNNRGSKATSRLKRAAAGILTDYSLMVEEADKVFEVAKRADSAHFSKGRRQEPTWTNYGTSKGIRNVAVRDLMARSGGGNTESWTTQRDSAAAQRPPPRWASTSRSLLHPCHLASLKRQAIHTLRH